MDPTDYHKISTGGWRGRIHRHWAGILVADGDPVQQLLSQPHEIVHQRESARTWRVESPGGVIFAKLASWELAGTKKQRHRAMRRLLGESAARRNFDLTMRMAQCGFRVPRVLLAARRRAGLRRVEDLLVTEAVPGRPLKQIIRQPGVDRAALLEMVGRHVAELHRCRFIHGDLLHGHIYVTADQTDVILIDNDDTRRWWPAPPAGRREINLKQLVYGVKTAWGYRLARRILDSYFEASGMSPARARRSRYRTLLAVRGRQRRRLQRQQNSLPKPLAAA